MESRKNIFKILFILIIMLLLVGTAVFFVDYNREKIYQSEAKYMIIINEKDEQESMNAYTASVAANRLAKLTAELVNTSDYIKRVYNKSGIIYRNEKINEYRKDIGAKVIEDTEIVKLWANNSSPSRAQRVTQAMIEVMREKIDNSSWSDKNFNIEIIDSPTIPYQPISPDYIRDMALSFFAVVIFCGLYYLIKE